jgi:hypothetical protein
MFCPVVEAQFDEERDLFRYGLRFRMLPLRITMKETIL